MRRLVAFLLVAGVFAAVARGDDASTPPGNEESRKLHAEAMTKGNAADYEGAVALFQKAIEADAKNFLAHFDLGGAYEKQKKFDDAIASYEKTVELAPTFAEAQLQLGTLYLLKKRDGARAIARFRAALLEKKPWADPRFTAKHTRSQALQNLAVAYATRGDEGMGVAIAASYLDDPDVERERDNSMRTLVQRAGPAVAKRSKPNFAEQLVAIGKTLHEGKHKEALAEYEKFAKEHPEADLAPIDAWQLHEGMGFAHAMLGEHEACAKAFEKAVTHGSKLGARQQLESRFNLACGLSELGKNAEALAALDELLWLESIARHGPGFAKAKSYAEKARTDSSLEKVRKDPGFEELLGRHAPGK
ncbi:MAG: tetratricopeptide repeat protein [Planctomycetota bacterium]